MYCMEVCTASKREEDTVLILYFNCTTSPKLFLKIYYTATVASLDFDLVLLCWKVITCSLNDTSGVMLQDLQAANIYFHIFLVLADTDPTIFRPQLATRD